VLGSIAAAHPAQSLLQHPHSGSDRATRVSAALRPWAVLVIADPSKVSGKKPPRTIEEPSAMLQRALSLASEERVCCVIADSFRPTWAGVHDSLRGSNRFSLRADEPVVKGLERCLRFIGSRDSKAAVIVIPYNHCAVEEVSWLESTRGALRLGNANHNAVYVLHDNPDNDPRVALQKPEVCTSSVMVGTNEALLALCLGKRATTIVNVFADPPEQAPESFTESAAVDAPLNLVHIRLVEEYSRLQRGSGSRPSRGVDIQV
jgi:hypothetical protein